MDYRKSLICIALIGTFFAGGAASAAVPQFGAQVIIEPGQTDDEIELWFRRMAESGMTVCRIRMFEEYMRDKSGNWDFTLFDKAFTAAERHGVQIFATLFPSAPGNSIGGFKFPRSVGHERQIEAYISRVVGHYKTSGALYAWVLMNEPGTGGELPSDDYTRTKFEEWQHTRARAVYDDTGSPQSGKFDKQEFLRYYNTWYLGWLAERVIACDPIHEIHVNNHQIFENVAEYDFPSWRNFLSSFGASAHPSWHYGYFERSRYVYAMSANCAIVRSGAGEKPFWITELQGGNNTYSGATPFCPTAEEITQWLWTGIASGAKGIIFWSLNPRSMGEEAGEWALLDFQNEASDRMNAIRRVATAVERDEGMFSDVCPIGSDVYVAYSHNSLWVEKCVQYGNKSIYEGRQPGGVMKSALACYEILCENGVVPDMTELGEFDWSRNDYTNTCMILANAVSLPSRHWNDIRNFVAKGGKLIAEGLTGFYDENMRSLFNAGFPLEDVFGGTVSEIKCVPGDFEMQMNGAIPVHLWKGYIRNRGGIPLATEDGSAVWLKHAYGRGEVIWMPSLLGLGARRTGNGKPLSDILLLALGRRLPVRLSRYERGVFMQTAQGQDAIFSVLINKNDTPRTLRFETALRPEVVFSDKQVKLHGRKLRVEPEGTVVLKWGANDRISSSEMNARTML